MIEKDILDPGERERETERQRQRKEITWFWNCNIKKIGSFPDIARKLQDGDFDWDMEVRMSNLSEKN